MSDTSDGRGPGWGGVGWVGGGLNVCVYLTLHRQNDSCIKIGSSDESRKQF